MMTTITITFVFFIAAANIAAGYMAAVYLGMGPRSFNEFQRALAPRKPLYMKKPGAGGAVSCLGEQALTNPVEQRCLELIRELQKFSTQCSRADTALRALTDDSATGETQSPADEIAARTCDETHAHLEALNTSIEPLQHSGFEEIEFVQGLAQLRASTDLVSVDLNSSIGGGMLQNDGTSPEKRRGEVIAAVDQIREVSHHYGSAIENSVLRMLQGAVGIDQIARPLFLGNDGLLTRYGIELLYQQQQATGAEGAAALLDLDHFGRFNSDYGGAAGDELFRSIASKTVDSISEVQRAARVKGWRILVLAPETTPEELARSVEHLRQLVARTCYQCNGKIARATISAGVSAIEKDEPSAALLERLSMTLAEAKNYGRNRTFVCENDVPAPVVPVELTISESAVFLV